MILTKNLGKRTKEEASVDNTVDYWNLGLALILSTVIRAVDTAITPQNILLISNDWQADHESTTFASDDYGAAEERLRKKVVVHYI